MIELRTAGGDVFLPVKVVPKASRDRIMGELSGMLKVSVSAAPERGAANEAVCKLIARGLGIRAGQVTVETGHASPRKTLRICGSDSASVKRLWAPAGPVDSV